MLDELDRRWLRELMARAVSCSLASLALPACIGDELQPPPDRRAANRPGSSNAPLGTEIEPSAPCASGFWELAHFFTLSREVNYVADRRGNLIVESESGTACLSALDQVRCYDALQTTGASLGRRHLLTTAGDEVQAWDFDDAPTIFGTVDAAEEAIWLALASGHSVACDARIAERTDAQGGFVVDVERPAQSCSGAPATVRGTVMVDPAGATSSTAPTGVVILGPCTTECRRPQGLRPCPRAAVASSLGERFAAMAHMEVASVPAFAAITAELVCHAAPGSLVRGARRAQRDEIRHARIASALARRFGATPTPAVVSPMPPRSLAAFALDNAIEGCVHETFAAARASHQAARAQDAWIRHALAGIAADETRHAALAWAIAEWVTPKLPPATRARMREAQREAVSALGAQLDAEAHDEQLAWAGLPAPRASRLMFDALRSTLWAA